jgi:hypothetical protein
MKRDAAAQEFAAGTARSPDSGGSEPADETAGGQRDQETSGHGQSMPLYRKLER